MISSMFEVGQVVHRAYAMVELAFSGEADQSSLDHAVRVARYVAGASGDPILTAVALVHEVTEFDLGTVEARLAPEVDSEDIPRVHRLLDALTHRDDEDRASHLDRVVAEPGAVVILLACLLEGLQSSDDPARIEANSFDLAHIAAAPVASTDFVVAGMLAMATLTLMGAENGSEVNMGWRGTDIELNPIRRSHLRPLPDGGWGGSVSEPEDVA